MHVKCPQKFRAGSDFDGDVNAKVGKYLQRDCELTMDQVSWLSIRDEGFGETTEAGTGGDQQSEPRLKVDDVKAGARKVTGSVFLRPGEKKTVQVIFEKNFLTQTQDLQFDQSSAESDDNSKGKSVPFEIKVPDNVALKEGDRLFFRLRDDSRRPSAGENKSTVVIVKPADNGNGRAPGGGAGDNSPKPPAPGGGAGEKPRKPHALGGGAVGNPRTGGGSLSSGSS